MTAFKDFGKMSGYKINVQKTQVITFNYEPNQYLRQSYKVNWDLKSMKYLGIYLPKELEKLKSTNYDKIIPNIKTDLSKWNLMPYLGLASRVEVIKMNILPRLLYLFQNLPVELSEKELKELDKIISRFIWQGAKPRIRYRTVQLPKGTGGLARPCLKKYFWAAQLRVLFNLCDPDYSARWKEIEEGLMERFPIQAIMSDDKLWSSREKNVNSWLGLSMEIWYEIVKKYNLTKKAISKLYVVLEDLKADNTAYIKERWEREATIEVTGEEWGEINTYQWKTTNSSSWREFGWKNTVRFFLTPVQRKFGDTKCWGSCGADKADHFHVFWGCPLINHYWKEIKKVIDEVLKIEIPLDFKILYLGEINHLNLQRREDYKMLRIMLLACKKAITRKYRSDQVPDMQEWTEIMLGIYNMEKLTASVRLEIDKFKKIWKSWLEYIGQYRPDFM